MTTLKEISVQSIGEPYSVKIERGQKGAYGYEIKAYGETVEECLLDVLHLKAKVEEELYGSCQGGCKDEKQTA